MNGLLHFRSKRRSLVLYKDQRLLLGRTRFLTTQPEHKNEPKPHELPKPVEPLKPDHIDEHLNSKMTRMIKEVVETTQSLRRNTYFFRIGALAFIFLLFLNFLYWDKIQKFLGKQTAAVTTLTLTDQDVQTNAKILAKEVVNELLESPETKAAAVQFVRGVLQDPETKRYVVELVNGVIVDPYFQETALHMANGIVKNILADQYTNDQLVILLTKVSQMPGSHEALKVLFTGLFHDPYIGEGLQQLFARVLASDPVIQQSNILAQATAAYVLQDPSINEMSKEFINSSLSSDSVQEAAGHAVWEAIKIAFTPAIFRSRNFPPVEPPPPTESEIPFSTTPEQNNLVVVPEEITEAVAEIIFRESYEATANKYGLVYNVEDLSEKKRFFADQIAKQKQTLSKPLRSALQKVIDTQLEHVFRNDQLIIDRGGKEGLIFKAKYNLENQISSLELYFQSMKKQEKGWVYNSYSSEQLEERKFLETKISELRRLIHDNEYCLNQSLLALGVTAVSPVGHLQRGTVEDILNEYHKTNPKTTPKGEPQKEQIK